VTCSILGIALGILVVRGARAEHGGLMSLLASALWLSLLVRWCGLPQPSVHLSGSRSREAAAQLGAAAAERLRRAGAPPRRVAPARRLRARIARGGSPDRSGCARS
jgi:hypothetical protein